jgi:hypothetical protein
MLRALWISAGVVLLATFAMFKAPPGQTDPLGTLFRTALATGLLIFLGRLAGTAIHRRPPSPLAARVVTLIFVSVALEVAATWFAPTWSVAFGVWYATLFAAGVLLNRWCAAPERYAILVGTFTVVAASLILMALSAASPVAQTDLVSRTVLVALWPNVTRIAGHPADAAWMWLAWRVADRLRPPEARRPKVKPRVAPGPAALRK